MSEKKLINIREMVRDSNGKLKDKYEVVDNRNAVWKNAHFVSDFVTADPGGANDIQLAEIEIPIGDILELYHITATSETGAKGIALATTTAVWAAPLSGVAGYNLLWAALITGTQIIADQSKEPFLIIDNSAGVTILYVNLYGINAFMDINQAGTEDLSAFMSGFIYTP